MKKLLLLGLTVAGMLITGCERRAKDEPQRVPGEILSPGAPCNLMGNCSDVR